MKKILTIIIIIFSLSQSFAQNKDSLALAEDLINNESFEQAIGFYKRFIRINPTDPDLAFKLGFCYLNTEGKRDSSIAYFKRSLELIADGHKSEITPREIKFYLARAYRVNYKFDSAITLLSQLRAETRSVLENL